MKIDEKNYTLAFGFHKSLLKRNLGINLTCSLLNLSRTAGICHLRNLCYYRKLRTAIIFNLIKWKTNYVYSYRISFVMLRGYILHQTCLLLRGATVVLNGCLIEKSLLELWHIIKLTWRLKFVRALDLQGISLARISFRLTTKILR